MQNLKEFVKAILAGGSISLGGFAYICCQNKIIGSLFFTVGLFLVLTANLNLLTGKFCYICQNDDFHKYAISILITFGGNLIGCVVCGLTCRLSNCIDFIQIFQVVLELKIDRPWQETIILSAFCNVCIFIAVKGYTQQEESWKRVLSLFFGVSIFVLCGFEHCIADLFYMTICNAWSLKSCIFIALVIVGNLIGGTLCSCVENFLTKKSKIE